MSLVEHELDHKSRSNEVLPIEGERKELVVYAQIERDIIKLNETMSILRNLVMEQQPSIDSIETFIEESKAHVTQSQSVLVQAEEYHAGTNIVHYVIGSVFAIAVYLFL